MGKTISPVKAKLSGIGLDVGAYALLLSATILIQWWTGAFASEFGNHPDEAGHFITGLMVHDYLWQSDWLHPLAFAEKFYVHYPKVALGHWPPFFYVLQALWTSVFPINRTSMILLMAVVTASLAVLVYREGRSIYGWWASMALAVLLLLLPPMQTSSGELMADILMALLCFQAARAFGRFLNSDRWQDSCAFGLWSTLAIMTKGTGFALALLPLPALLFSRRLDLLRCWKFWLPAAIVAVICAPWYVVTMGMVQNGWSDNNPSWAYFFQATVDYLHGVVLIFGLGLASVALVGLFAKLLQPLRQGGVCGMWSSFGGWLIAFFIFHCAVPNGVEERFLLPILPIIVLAIAAGAAWIVSLFPDGLLRWSLRRIVPVLLAILFLTGAEPVWHPRPVSGYGQAVDKILEQAGERNLVILVSSDSSGEGMLVSEMALRDRRLNHVVLRASKVLSASNWAGKDFALTFAYKEETARYLKQIPVDFIVLDTTIPIADQLPDHRQLMTVVESCPQEYVLVNKIPMIRRHKSIPDAIHVYRLTRAAASSPRIIRIPMDFMLGKTLEVSLP